MTNEEEKRCKKKEFEFAKWMERESESEGQAKIKDFELTVLFTEVAGVVEIFLGGGSFCCKFEFPISSGSSRTLSCRFYEKGSFHQSILSFSC